MDSLLMLLTLATGVSGVALCTLALITEDRDEEEVSEPPTEAVPAAEALRVVVPPGASMDEDTLDPGVARTRGVFDPQRVAAVRVANAADEDESELPTVLCSAEEWRSQRAQVDQRR